MSAWRSGKLDWHELLPKHSSLWERYGESKDDKFNFMKLVMKETKMTDYVTQYVESGLAGFYGTDHGPLRNYSGCNLLNDPCGVHNEATCRFDSFCSWDGARLACVDDKNGGKPCASARNLKVVRGGRIQSTDNLQVCSRHIHERVFVEHVQDDPATMFYHWFRYFKTVFASVRGKGGLDKRNHFIVDKPPNTQFFHYFGLLAHSCWRRPTQIPDNTCFCNVEEEELKGEESEHTDLLGFLLEQLELDPEHGMPAPAKVRVGIISRRRKRFILNEDELVRAVLALGFEVQILPLEEMTLYEQLAALRMTTVLIGIHGSGLNNAIFMPRGGAMIQLLPYKLNYKGAFSSIAHEAGVHYFEWGLTDPTKSMFHWEFLGERELRDGKQAVLDRGSPRGGAEVYTFWINQDIIVPVDEFTELVKKAVDESELNRKLKH